MLEFTITDDHIENGTFDPIIIPEGTTTITCTSERLTKLPDIFKKIKGNLDLRDHVNSRTVIDKDGSLNLRRCKNLTLPEGMEVGGCLFASGRKNLTLPKDLKIGGALNVSSCENLTLPESLEVKGNLHAYNSKNLTLSKGTKVEGSIDLITVKTLHCQKA